MAYLAVGEREEALDIVQDAMLKLARSYGDRDEGQWRLLFYRILRNRIQDHFRQRKVRALFGSLSGFGEQETAVEAAEPIAAREGGPLNQLVASDAMRALDEAVQGLPGRQQQVFLLRLWEGLDVAETARVMGCSQGSVKTHYSRALNKLREILGEHWP